MGFLRIIAGEQRGRRIRVPPGASARPTADRAREALFSILVAEVRGATVLDAYAGSGALGFEALSRGARSVEFVESDPQAVVTLRENAAALGLDARCRIHLGPVLVLVRRRIVRGPFELILADPPYGSAEQEGFLRGARDLLAGERGLVVLERDSRGHASCIDGLEHVRTATYGRCALDFYRRSPRETVRAAPGAGTGPGPGHAG